jgi:hypothetical protein
MKVLPFNQPLNYYYYFHKIKIIRIDSLVNTSKLVLNL